MKERNQKQTKEMNGWIKRRKQKKESGRLKEREK